MWQRDNYYLVQSQRKRRLIMRRERKRRRRKRERMMVKKSMMERKTRGSHPVFQKVESHLQLILINVKMLLIWLSPSLWIMWKGEYQLLSHPWENQPLIA